MTPKDKYVLLKLEACPFDITALMPRCVHTITFQPSRDERMGERRVTDPQPVHITPLHTLASLCCNDTEGSSFITRCLVVQTLPRKKVLLIESSDFLMSRKKRKVCLCQLQTRSLL